MPHSRLAGFRQDGRPAIHMYMRLFAPMGKMFQLYITVFIYVDVTRPSILILEAFKLNRP